MSKNNIVIKLPIKGSGGTEFNNVDLTAGSGKITSYNTTSATVLAGSALRVGQAALVALRAETPEDKEFALYRLGLSVFAGAFSTVLARRIDGAIGRVIDNVFAKRIADISKIGEVNLGKKKFAKGFLSSSAGKSLREIKINALADSISQLDSLKSPEVRSTYSQTEIDTIAQDIVKQNELELDFIEKTFKTASRKQKAAKAGGFVAGVGIDVAISFAQKKLEENKRAELLKAQLGRKNTNDQFARRIRGSRISIN